MEKEDFIGLEKSGMKILETSDLGLISNIVSSGLAKSRTQAREFLKSGAISINGKKVIIEDDVNTSVITDIKFDHFCILQRGRKEFRLIKIK